MGGIDRMIENRRNGVSMTGNEAADQLLQRDPNAVLYGVLYDQQIRAEQAFAGAYTLRERLGFLDAGKIAAMDPAAFAAIFTQSPSVHRFGNMMAERTQRLAGYVAEDLDGNPSRLWNDAPSDDLLRQRAEKLPGFGKSKADVLVHALALFDHRKQLEGTT